MKRNNMLGRPAALAVAAILVGLTLTTTSRAVTSLVVPNAATVSFALGAGGVTGAITVPVVDRPVDLTGVTTTVNFRGVGFVKLLRTGVAPLLLEWVGLDSTAGAAITQGFSSAAGTKIVFIDFSHQVRVEVASASAVRVRNLSTGVRSGNLLFIY